MGGANVEPFGKVIFEAHPLVTVAHLSAPGANPQHAFEIMKLLHEPARERQDKSPNEQNEHRFYRSIAPFGSMRLPAHNEMRQINDLV